MNHFVIHRIHREIHIDSIFFMTTILICAYVCMERLRVQYKLVCHFIVVQYDDWDVIGYSIYIIYMP